MNLSYICFEKIVNNGLFVIDSGKRKVISNLHKNKNTDLK